jgi:alanine racemase
VLIGRQGESELTLEAMAALAGTIDYEIACGLGARLSRVYRSASEDAHPAA